MLSARIDLTAKGAKPDPAAETKPGAWYAIWTRSHCERLVAEQLSAKGLDAFLPEMPVTPWTGRSSSSPSTPMFPGYLFVHETMDKTCYIEILKARGVVRILENGWTRLTPIPDEEIDGVRRLIDANTQVWPCPYLSHGDRVLVMEGPLSGLEGLFVSDRHQKQRLVLSIGLLGRSVAVEIDAAAVTPAQQARA
jgi:transcription antitermination factor NusG